MTIQTEFSDFDVQHPDIYQHFKQVSKELLRTGHGRYSADGVLHIVRWERRTTAEGVQPFKINNNFSSRYARKLIEEGDAEVPADFFELRILKSP